MGGFWRVVSRLGDSLDTQALQTWWEERKTRGTQQIGGKLKAFIEGTKIDPSFEAKSLPDYFETAKEGFARLERTGSRGY